MGLLLSSIAGGTFDSAFIEEMRSISRALSAPRPTPTGRGRWTPEDIDDLIFDTIKRVEPAKVVIAANAAGSEAEFRGWLATAVRTTLNLRARETASGTIIRAMDDALRKAPGDFSFATGNWMIKGEERPLSWEQNNVELMELAWQIETTNVHVSERAAHSMVLGLREDIRAVSTAVLGRSGPLPKAQLAEILAERFNVPFASPLGYLEDVAEDSLPGRRDEGVASSVDEEAAIWMLGQLTDEERRHLRALLDSGSTIRALADRLGCSIYRADLYKKRVEEKIKRLADFGEDGQAATLILLRYVGQDGGLRH